MKENLAHASLAHTNGYIKNLGIWIRISTEGRGRSKTAQRQEHHARVYAESKGWNVRRIYGLVGASGASVMEHSETKRMLSEIKSRHISGLIFSELTRLSRNTCELEYFIEFFQNNNAHMICLQDAIQS